MNRIPFNVPPVTGREIEYLQTVLAARRLAGNGEFSARCQSWLTQHIGACDALITHSCTAALEMASILAGIESGDEVIMPSYTFVSTANAVVLRGGTPVFVDIRQDTLNIDENRIEAAITRRTKAICVVHYAGVCAQMDEIVRIAKAYDLLLIEDAAQALLSTFDGQQAGRFGALSCFSFHETKNVSSGEGGALVINDEMLADRARIIWEKGTNRRAFRLGVVDKYTWVDVGSSFLPSEFVAAVLFAQLEAAALLTKTRLELWSQYHAAFERLEERGPLRRPCIPKRCGHNGHLYYILLRDRAERDRLIAGLESDGIMAPFHYVPLHSSPAGTRFGRISGDLAVTNTAGDRLMRLPLFVGLDSSEVERVVESVHSHLGTAR